MLFAIGRIGEATIATVELAFERLFACERGREREGKKGLIRLLIEGLID